jgi:hypothetical protein
VPGWIYVLRVSEHKTTQALKAVKITGNTFDLNPKWARTLPSIIYFSWDINRNPPPQLFSSNIRFDI